MLKQASQWRAAFCGRSDTRFEAENNRRDAPDYVFRDGPATVMAVNLRPNCWKGLMLQQREILQPISPDSASKVKWVKLQWWQGLLFCLLSLMTSADEKQEEQMGRLIGELKHKDRFVQSNVAFCMRADREEGAKNVVNLH